MRKILNIISVHYTFINSQLWLTSHPRRTDVVLDTGTPGTSRGIYSEDSVSLSNKTTVLLGWEINHS